MSVVARYLSRLIFARIMGVGLVLAALLQIMDLVDNVDDVLERRNSVADLFVFASYRLPSIVESVIPISVLLGTITVFLALAGRSELDALRSGGLSQGRLVMLCLPVCLLFAAFHFVLVDRVVPSSQQAYVEWWEPPVNRGELLWLRGTESIVSVAERSRDGTALGGLTIYERDRNGRLTARIEADHASHDGAGWVLSVVEVEQFDGGLGTEVTRYEQLPWADGPEPATIEMLQQPPERLQSGLMNNLLAETWTGITEPASYRTELAGRYAAPLASLVMLLLASPAMRRQGRSSAALIGGFLGLSLGLGFVVAGGILNALGRAGALAPTIAAWLPVLAFGAIGLFLLRRSET